MDPGHNTCESPAVEVAQVSAGERYLAKAILVSPAKFSSAEAAQAMVISAGMSVSIRGDLHGVSDSGRRPVG